MRKPTFCICKNKDADQLRSNREADQCLCFRYTDTTIPPTVKISGIPLESTRILVEFYWNSSGIKGTFFHWKMVIPLEFPLDYSGNSTGSVEIPLDSVEIPLDSSGILLDSSGIPLGSSGNSIGIP